MQISNYLARREAPHSAISTLIFFGCATALLTAPFGGSFGRNVFYITSYIAFITLATHALYYAKLRINIALPVAMLLVGIASIIWTAVYKQPGDFISLYRQYQSTGRLQISGALILFFVLNDKSDLRQKAILAALLTGLAVNAYAIYQGVWLHLRRVELNFDRATMAAYIISAVNLLFLKAILFQKNKLKLFLFPAAFLFSYLAIILTGTRAAMLLFPVMALILVLFSKNVISRRYKIALFVIIPALFIAGSLIFKEKIANRIDEFQQNIADMHKNRGENSVVSRLSMQIIALQTGIESPAGQSAEQRALLARKIIQQQPQLYGALPYLTVHMHNEVLETFSIKGIAGALALVNFYIMLLVYAFRRGGNALLLTLALALIGYGLSDVIFFSTECTLIYCLTIIFAFSMMKGPHHQEKNQ
ncbi:O-antigen ligase family protein [Pantoea eucrina]|uniref:O-antigen ligase family protein n=1 Tax=Pantoea eucrina TaxID=472693 RepID=UPI0024B70FDD|nr:O-antigen ligase family protein [Pantoea eucrina]MDJ0022947.1 O-antigen ligase family protein [Pantoea eucrina]